MEQRPLEQIKKTKILEALENAHTTVSFEDPLGSEMVLNMGPQHPSTHGVLRLVLRTDGEIVSEVTPHIGYLHRCFEKMSETHGWNQVIPYTDRLNYCSSHINGAGFALAVERMLGVEAPPRAQAIHVILSELSRIMDHAVCLGALLVVTLCAAGTTLAGPADEKPAPAKATDPPRSPPSRAIASRMNPISDPA